LRRPGPSRAPDARREVLHDVEVDVGLEQGETDLAHRARNRFLVERPALSEVPESALKPVS
jgi:hypothetical protein